MAENPTAGSPVPAWEYLIAHHLPQRYCRTLPVRAGSRTYHLCTRCTGELVGFLSLLFAFLLVPEFAHVVSTPEGGLLLAALPSVALLDWLSQSVGGRESTNGLRLVSGALVGVALGGFVAYGLTGHWLLFGGAVAVLCVYLAAAAIVLFRTGSLQRVVAEHFP